MNCEEVMELMQRHVDEDLNEQETLRMMNHVGHCPECAGMLERLVQLSRGLEQLPRVVPPYSLVDAILPQLSQWDAAGMESSGSAPVSPGSRRAERTRRTWIGRVSGVVALGIVIGLLLVFNRPLDGNPEAGSQDTASSPEAAQKQFSITTTMQGSAEASGSPEPPAVFVAPDDSSKKSFSPDTPASQPSAQPSSGDSIGSTGNTGEPGVGAGGKSDGRAAANFSEKLPAPTTGSSVEPVPVDPPAPNGNQNKGYTATTERSTEPPVSIMSVQSNQEVVSPDGKWKAVLSDGELKLIRMSDESVVYQSAPDDGKRSGLVWSEDSTMVNYTFTDAEGNQSNIGLLVPGAPLK